MTVKQLRDILAQANDDDSVFVTRTRYNGNDDETTIEEDICILTGGEIVITDFYTARQLYYVKL